MKKKSFALLEIIIIAIIISILAGLALPQYLKSRENAIGKEARANLKLIAAAERIYRLEGGFYYPRPSPSGTYIESDPALINTFLKLDLDERHWDYAITTSASDAFTATTRRQSGPYSSCQYSLAHNDADGEPDVVGGTCP